MSKRATFIISLGALVLGLLGGYQYANSPRATQPSKTLRENSADYVFTNPLLLTQSSSNIPTPKFDTLRSSLVASIKQIKAASNAYSVSVYLRNMDNGEWTGVNEGEMYAPGSMLKVPIMIGYLNEAENHPEFLDAGYYYNPEVDQGQYFKPAVVLSQGTHTTRDLIKNMIIESDNTATLILANDHPDIVERVYKDLALPDPKAGADFMSPKEYASFWRVLYNGTYLSHNVSEEALSLLSLTTFNDGLVAGLPKGTRIAHKFGEHTTLVPGEPAQRELHDCGIVYPDGVGPYFLCVMTRGADFEKLEHVISDISKTVYERLPRA